jgi:hypothetical protein
MNNTRRTEKDWKQVYARYKAGVSVRKLAAELGVHVMTIYSAFARHGLDRNVERVNDKVDESYFETIRTPTEAYALGLWLADGSTTKNAWTIKLAKSDEAILRRISDDFYKTPRPLSYEDNACMFFGYSVKVARRLRSKFRGSKTKNLRLDSTAIPKALMPSVIRGIFDGDGSISYRRDRPNQRQIYICSISESFLKDIGAVLGEAGIASYVCRETRAGKRLRVPGGWTVCSCDMYKLFIGTHASRVAFYEYLYHNSAGPRIERKYDKFTQYHGNAVQLLALKAPALPSDPAPYHEQHLNGRSIRDIGRELKRCGSTVSRWFMTHGLDIRSRVTRRS